MNLRESKGYTYGAYSQFDAREYKGTVAATADVRTDVVEGALTEFFNEFHRIVNESTPVDELAKSKRALAARLAFAMERPETWIAYRLLIEKYGFPADYWDHYADNVMAVTAADVQRVAKKYYNLEGLQIIAVGDASKIGPVLSKWGEPIVYDTEGKLRHAPWLSQ